MARWRRPDDPPEVARELRLVIEANLGGHVGRLYAAMEQLLRACDAEVREIGMRRHSNLCTKGAAQVELVEVGVVREMVERDRVAESLTEVLECASDGTRVVRMRVADDPKRTNSFHDSDLEREAVNSCAHGIDEAVEWRRVPRRAQDLARQREA